MCYCMDMNTTTVTLRCRAEKNAAADRFEKMQCPNKATGTTQFGGSEYPTCGTHSSARSSNLYRGTGWRRAI